MQRGLYRAAKQALGRRFALLYSHIYKEETLTEGNYSDTFPPSDNENALD